MSDILITIFFIIVAISIPSFFVYVIIRRFKEVKKEGLRKDKLTVEERRKEDERGLFYHVNPSHWRIDGKELENQVKNYNTLGFGSFRKIAVCFIVFSMVISLIWVTVGWSPPVELIDVLIWAVLAVFVYRGSKLAIIIAMLCWTLEKVLQIISGFSGENFNGVNIIAPVVFWGIYMSVLWPTYQIERARRKLKKQNL